MAYAALPRINFFDSRKKDSISYVLADDWWIVTLTTEIQANIDNMVAQAKGEEDDE